MDWSTIYRRIAKDPEDAEAYQAVKVWAKVLAWRTMADFGGDDVADIVAETCARIYLRFADARGPDTFRGFAIGQFQSVRQRRIRQRSGYQLVNSLDGTAGEVAAEGPEIDERVIQTEQIEQLRECVNRLTEREQIAVKLHFIRGAKFRSIGAQLDLSEDAARQLVHRSRLRLRDCLDSPSLTRLGRPGRSGR